MNVPHIVARPSVEPGLPALTDELAAKKEFGLIHRKLCFYSVPKRRGPPC